MWIDVDAAFAEMTELTRQMDALLGHRGLDGRHGLRGGGPAGEWTRSEAGDRLSWSTDLPGARSEDLQVTVEDGTLTVVASRVPAAPVGYGVRWSERRARELRRSWRLPEDADLDGIEAKLDDGVLTVTVPRRPRPEPRSVPVTVA